MKEKIYEIEGLDCANCAAKAEAAIRRVPGVEAAAVVFSAMQLRLTAEDPDALLPQVLAAARKAEPDIRFMPRGSHAHRGHAHHGHDHGHEGHGHEDHDHSHGDRDLPALLVGGGLFVLGLLLSRFPLAGRLVLAAAYVVLGFEVLKTAGKNILHGKIFDENFLMSLATLGALAIGEFPEAVGVMLFYRVGELFEHRAAARSRSQIMAAVDLRPETVTLLDGSVIPAEEAKAGDVLVVRPGDRIPLDSVVLSGESRLDTSPITGEPVPVPAGPGAAVVSGCVNLSGRLTLRVEKPLSASMVTRILHAVENAAAGKPRAQRFITRFSAVYTPVVVALAAVVAVVPSLVTGDWGYWVYTALSFLVMSCPCALVLSVPLAFFSGIGAGSRRGILFKGGASMEALAGVRAVALDKTGTVTQGVFAVQEVEGGDEILRLAAGCETSSTHPIGAGIVAAARERGLEIPAADGVEELAGRGIIAQIGGKTVLCGSEKLLRERGVSVPDTAAPVMGTRVFLAVEGVYAGAVRISDALKPDAVPAVARLKADGLTVAILTGDAVPGAQAAADALGVREVHARLLPEEKLARLQAIREKYGPVMFVGDGINDAPVLSGADVGAAMGSGADAAIEAADVVFMTNAVDAVPEAVDIARRARRAVRQNIVFALAMKFGVMLLGLLGWASMWAAVFADSGVAMLCVLNSVRLLYRREEKK